ncbi:MAG: M3 family metallopeptidase, partial [Candidatus Woesearchaeota archaeon]
IYHTPFYCYAYAFGNLMGLSLYGEYDKDRKGFPEKYMRLLASGGSLSPADILKKQMGIEINDRTFWQEGFDIIKLQVKELKDLM